MGRQPWEEVAADSAESQAGRGWTDWSVFEFSTFVVAGRIGRPQDWPE